VDAYKKLDDRSDLGRGGKSEHPRSNVGKRYHLTGGQYDGDIIRSSDRTRNSADGSVPQRQY